MPDFMNPSRDLQAGRQAGREDRQREIDDLLEQIADLEERIAAEEAAKIPRPPKAGWFEKWGSWRVTDKEGRMYYLANCKYINRADGHRIDGCAFHELRYSKRIGDSIAQPPLVLPVDLQGIPAGWHTVGE